MIVGCVLAAGSGSRLGGGKLLRLVAGRPLLSYTVNAALGSGLDRVLIVRSKENPETDAAIPVDGRISILENSGAERGHMSSLKLALASVTADAYVVLLADMPLVTAGLIDALLAAFRADGRCALPVCDGRWRHPRLLNRAIVPAFLALADDERGTAALRARPDGVTELEWADSNLFLDVDRPEDLLRAQRLLAG